QTLPAAPQRDNWGTSWREGEMKQATMHGSSRRGLSLTEMLVVLSIMIILMAVLIPALGAFTHTTRVIAAADTLAKVFREARFLAMSEGVPTVPIILRDRNGKFRVTYAKKALQFRGTLLKTQGAPITFLPANVGVTAQPWTMVKQETDLRKLMGGAF